MVSPWKALEEQAPPWLPWMEEGAVWRTDGNRERECRRPDTVRLGLGCWPGLLMLDEPGLLPSWYRQWAATRLFLRHAPRRLEGELRFAGQDIGWQIPEVYWGGSAGHVGSRDFAWRLLHPAPSGCWEFCGSAPIFKGPGRTFAHTCLPWLLTNT